MAVPSGTQGGVMISNVLFLCLGFIAAVLCIDLRFDVACWRHRRDPKGVPAEILEPAVRYYRTITRAPQPLSTVILAALACVALETVYQLVPRSFGYPALALFGLASLVGILKVIPTAQQLASTNEAAEQRRIVFSLLPYHVAMLASVLLLAGTHVAAVSDMR